MLACMSFPGRLGRKTFRHRHVSQGEYIKCPLLKQHPEQEGLKNAGGIQLAQRHENFRARRLP